MGHSLVEVAGQEWDHGYRHSPQMQLGPGHP